MDGSSRGRKVLVLLVPLIVLVAIVESRKDTSQQDEVTNTAEPSVEMENQTATSKAATQKALPVGPEPADQRTNSPSMNLLAARSTPLSEELGDDLETKEWDGDWLTSAAIEKPVMSELPTTDSSYDGAIEARQRFHPFEVDLRAAKPLDSANYRALISKHKASNAATLRRVMELRSQGREQAANALYEEWSRLFELYRKQVYPQDSVK